MNKWPLGRAGIVIKVYTAEKILEFHHRERMLKNYKIAVGKPSTPTPIGIYKVTYKVFNPGGILGTRWLGLDIPGGNYGIHGTNNPSSIGKAVSKGCIRMYNHDIEEIYPRVPLGTPVEIYLKH